MVGKLPLRLAALAICVYFLYFAIGAFHAGFAPDDPMNLGKYWLRGFWGGALDDVKFWSTAYRPMGAMFYLPIYHVFGMNPIPYRIAVFALLASNLYFSFRIAEWLTGSKAVGALTAVLVCAHAAMLPVYYNTSMIYDVLAYFFMAATLFCYIRFRQGGHELSVGQSAVVICAYVAALDSKELVVVGAGWILAYELLFHRPWKLRVPVLLMVVSVIYALGKFLGPEPLSKQPGYLLEPTLHRYFVNNRLYVNDILSTTYFDTSRKLIIAWCLLTVVCAIARKRELWWCWVVVSTSTLGVSFTVVPRGGASLYVPLLGWGLLVSIFVVGFFKREAVQWGAAALVALFACYRTVPLWDERRQAYLDDHALTGRVISQFCDLPARPAPKSHVLFLSNPFRDWDTYFIANLVWNDHTLDVELANKLDHPPDMNQYDWVLEFEGDRLRVVRTR
jgi:hypothetical protein